VTDIQEGARDCVFKKSPKQQNNTFSKPFFYVSRKNMKKTNALTKIQNSSKFKNPMCFIYGGSHQTRKHANHVSLQPDCSRNQTKHVAAFLPTHRAEFAERGFVFSVLLNGLQCTALRDTSCNYYFMFNKSFINDSFQLLNREICLTALFGQQLTLPLFMVRLQSKQFGSDEAVCTVLRLRQLVTCRLVFLSETAYLI
jgi:hypothetical protein